MSYITIKVEVTTTTAGNVYVHIVTSSESISSKVFAIEVLPTSRDKTTPKYRLSHICSVAEMEELPEDEPGDESSYFRVNDIGMIFDTAVIAAQAIQRIKDDIRRLGNEYAKLYELITGGTISPEPGPDDPSLIPNIYYEDL